MQQDQHWLERLIVLKADAQRLGEVYRASISQDSLILSPEFLAHSEASESYAALLSEHVDDLIWLARVGLRATQVKVPADFQRKGSFFTCEEMVHFGNEEQSKEFEQKVRTDPDSIDPDELDWKSIAAGDFESQAIAQFVADSCNVVINAHG